jgi:transcriptional regulator with XRE-family HTH domain
MTERIFAILKYLQLSPSQFAEEIGVQRSSISHLISGRNKPSLEFIQKVLTRFPEISSQWILNGEGEMLKSGQPLSQVSLFQEVPQNELPEVKKETERPESPGRVVKKKAVETEGKQIEKIVYFYKDKSFREYFPE